MSSSVVRLTGGEVIQIRTGVIQGIGPQGPVGPTGSVGGTGPQGPQGSPGPQGAIVEFSTEVGATAQSISSATPSLVAWPTVIRDDTSAILSTTNFGLTSGQWYVNAWVQLSKQSSIAATGSRTLNLLYGSTVIGATTFGAPSSRATDLTCSTAFVSTTPSTIFQVQILHDEGATLSIITGRLWFSRVGPGAQGITGPAGPTGSAGPTGAQGPIGPAGSLVDNTTTYATIGG